MIHKKRILTALKLNNFFKNQRVMVNGINIFPYIRISFFIYLIRRDSDYKHTFAKRVIEVLTAVVNYYVFNKKATKIDSNTTNLFLSYSTFRRNKINNLWFDIYVDSYILANNLMDNANILVVPHRGIFKNSHFHKSIYLNPLLQLLARLYARKSSIKIDCPDFDKAEKYMSDFGFSLTRNQLRKKLAELIYYKNYFKKILQGSNIKNVYVTAFSMNYSMGLVWAANELGIKTFELQHGSVYEDSPYYCHWNGENSPFLPKKFLVWTKEQEKFINDTCKGYPTAEADGNNYFKVFKNKLLSFTDYDKIWEKFIKTKNTILISLNRDDLPTWTIDPLLKLINQNYSIILRAHPGLNNMEFIKIQTNIKKLLDSNNVFLNEFEDVPLFYILNKISFLITGKSTVIIEASFFNKKSIIITNDGLEYFNHQIENKILALGYSSKKFQTALKKII